MPSMPPSTPARLSASALATPALSVGTCRLLGWAPAARDVPHLLVEAEYSGDTVSARQRCDRSGPGALVCRFGVLLLAEAGLGGDAVRSPGGCAALQPAGALHTSLTAPQPPFAVPSRHRLRAPQMRCTVALWPRQEVLTDLDYLHRYYGAGALELVGCGRRRARAAPANVCTAWLLLRRRVCALRSRPIPCAPTLTLHARRGPLRAPQCPRARARACGRTTPCTAQRTTRRRRTRPGTTTSRPSWRPSRSWAWPSRTPSLPTRCGRAGAWGLPLACPTPACSCGAASPAGAVWPGWREMARERGSGGTSGGLICGLAAGQAVRKPLCAAVWQRNPTHTELPPLTLQANLEAARGWALEAAELWAAFLQAGGRRPADEAAAHRLDSRYFSCARDGGRLGALQIALPRWAAQGRSSRAHSSGCRRRLGACQPSASSLPCGVASQPPSRPLVAAALPPPQPSRLTPATRQRCGCSASPPPTSFSRWPQVTRTCRAEAGRPAAAGGPGRGWGCHGWRALA